MQSDKSNCERERTTDGSGLAEDTERELVKDSGRVCPDPGE